TDSSGKVGEDFFDITLLRLESPIIGNFVPKSSPSGFGNSLTHSNLRPSNAPWELFSDRNKNEARRAVCLAGSLIHLAPVKDDDGSFTSSAALIAILFTRPRNGNNEFAVFLGDEVFALAG